MKTSALVALLAQESAVRRDWRVSVTTEGPDKLKVWAPNPEGIAGFASEVCLFTGNPHLDETPAALAFAVAARNAFHEMAEELIRLRTVLREEHEASRVWHAIGDADQDELCRAFDKARRDVEAEQERIAAEDAEEVR